MLFLWKHIPPKLAHDLAPIGIHIYADLFGSDEPLRWKSFNWRKIHFPNPVGIAGGVDKNALSILDYQSIGVGFAEIGTVTPLPQDSNPGRILDRDWNNKNLWNKMGFPNYGASEIALNMQQAKSEIRIPVFVNIGKNRNTPNENAKEDYIKCIEKFKDLADAFVINISSPNTAGLRALQSRDYLQPLIQATTQASQNTPVLLKLSPDLSEQELHQALLISIESGISGFILTNTTLWRPGGCTFPIEGGLSGASLAEKSKQTLKSAIKILGEKRKGLLIVSVGGVSTSEDVKERLALGADLVQIYSGMIFEGPGIFKKIGNKIGSAL